MKRAGIFGLNANEKRRLEILNIKNPKYLGGVERIQSITLKQLKTLVEEEFIDLDESQNYSPTVEEFLSFMETYPKIRAHGYIVSPEREDYRISIEGLQGTYDKNYLNDVDMLIDFVDLCMGADDLQITNGKLYSWWD